MYLPIILDLVKRKSSDGVSISTWITNVASFSLALIYPIKKKFALTTYIEIIALHIQSFIILGLICFYERKVNEFLIGSGLFALAMGLLFSLDMSVSLLSSLQILRLGLDGYSLIPQILMNFKNGLFSYNEITALMSGIGNAMRIFTTLQLVKDPLVLAGYVTGFVSNAILLIQFFLYGRKR